MPAVIGLLTLFLLIRIVFSAVHNVCSGPASSTLGPQCDWNRPLTLMFQHKRRISASHSAPLLCRSSTAKSASAATTSSRTEVRLPHGSSLHWPSPRWARYGARRCAPWPSTRTTVGPASWRPCRTTSIRSTRWTDPPPSWTSWRRRTTQMTGGTVTTTRSCSLRPNGKELMAKAVSSSSWRRRRRMKRWCGCWRSLSQRTSGAWASHTRAPPSLSKSDLWPAETCAAARPFDGNIRGEIRPFWGGNFIRSLWWSSWVNVMRTWKAVAWKQHSTQFQDDWTVNCPTQRNYFKGPRLFSFVPQWQEVVSRGETHVSTNGSTRCSWWHHKGELHSTLPSYTLSSFCEESIKFTWHNMGPLRVEFAFLSLSSSQDVTLPYIAMNGVSLTFWELFWRQNCGSLWMVIFLCLWEPSHGWIPKSVCTRSWTCLICMKGMYLYSACCLHCAHLLSP